jgi:gamma-butyrobetaine dioxygenase
MSPDRALRSFSCFAMASRSAIRVLAASSLAQVSRKSCLRPAHCLPAEGAAKYPARLRSSWITARRSCNRRLCTTALRRTIEPDQSTTPPEEPPQDGGSPATPADWPAIQHDSGAAPYRKDPVELAYSTFPSSQNAKNASDDAPAQTSPLEEQIPGLPRPFHMFWRHKGKKYYRHQLRESCTCETCVDPSSGQRRFGRFQIGVKTPEWSSIKEQDDGSVVVRWKDDFMPNKTGNEEEDGDHLSVYSAEQMAYMGLRKIDLPEVQKKTRMFQRLPWDREVLEREMQTVSYDDWITGSSKEFWDAFAQLSRLGLVIVKGVPDRETAIEDVAHAIGPVENTIYGNTWDVVSKPDAENIAYTSEYLGLHQDLLYWETVPKLQILHCLANECEGGESIFSDGLRADVVFLHKEPRWHEYLCSKPVFYHYRRGGHSYAQLRPVLDHYRNVRKLNWSPPFEQSMRHGDGWLKDYYTAQHAFEKVLSDPAGVYRVKLGPGDCVVFDNTRVLHGRQAFNAAGGRRHLRGTYIEEQVFWSKHVQLPAGYEDILSHRKFADQEEEELVQKWLGLEPPEHPDLRFNNPQERDVAASARDKAQYRSKKQEKKQGQDKETVRKVQTEESRRAHLDKRSKETTAFEREEEEGLVRRKSSQWAPPGEIAARGEGSLRRKPTGGRLRKIDYVRNKVECKVGTFSTDLRG